ncbi:hypothetical protein LTR91_011697 [Friedmanniomyces endolithicus]|uniref:Uncharacterized protein n=1 Tax=Friedmanniomyces endolithicus TaxID=329885 RepID=A0AAN6FP96_9PEZI|nr:hypothetical protein LTR35_015663 [Friedmanniomyces endolithicus]KAK0283977.1 hypothetical protein LTS00_011418 [Friedmanniomyces endolithicus]KAK0312760.1 hypothetical protein LTR01_002422 [Friedmanniomyces endolithicus]KAK0321917.1 hypothetical protein LTR82_006888 [Friedmanniomyces endolithicus]KAK0827475.1 hypothetical protein LTR73_005714 [Friedmanniomyces endolithicus]
MAAVDEDGESESAPPILAAGGTVSEGPWRAPVIAPFARTTTTSSTERPRTSQGLSAKSHNRRSYHDAVPALPAIPARFLQTGRPASVSGPPRSPRSRDTRPKESSRGADPIAHASLRVESLGASTDDAIALTYEDWRRLWNINNGLSEARDSRTYDHSSATLLDAKTRRKSLPAIPARHAESLSRIRRRVQDATGTGTEDMSRRSRAKEEDLFMELAQDNNDKGSEVRPPSHGERAASRLSQSGKRRSLPAGAVLTSSAERRPKSSGNAFPRSSSRLSGFPSDLQRHVDHYRQSRGHALVALEDVSSISGRSISGRQPRFAGAQESGPAPSRLAERMRSPDLPSFGKRRPSYGAPQAPRHGQMTGRGQLPQDQSPVDNTESKHSLPDSASVESTTDTVWDELDDLKTRIKKLELTGKLPVSSSAAVSGDSSDRPRTATTAPTTIESSPKHERKPETDVKSASVEGAVGGPNAANIHPLLHAALTKAKSLLSGPLYRSLEATASDALQLAAMTGGAGPQGTTFSAASIINGVTVSDHLTLALCEGKREASSVTASPMALEPLKSTPSVRYSRSNMGRGDSPARAVERPMSRLEARRTSILGVPPAESLGGNGRRGSAEEASASEHENTPSHAPPQLRRVSRPSSRLLSTRMTRYDDASGDEDPTIRPPSRAMTDVGNLRSKAIAQRERNSPAQPIDSPSLRSGGSATRRANASAFESNREQSRVMSLNSDAGRRRWTKEATPPVMEEEMGESGQYQPSSQPRRRITSLGQFGTRRAVAADAPGRATSFSQRRQVVVE